MDGAGGRGSRSSQSTLSNYRLGKTLGIGSFGKVRVAQHTLTGVKVAIKILDRQSLDDSAAAKVIREINIMRLLSHPHIVRLYEVIETRLSIYVIMEYMNSGELFDYITESGRLQEDEARHFFQQIISGVESCHLQMVVHRDLKPENLLLDSKGNVKIIDFGLSNVMRDGHFLKTSCGSPNYAAPEVISGRLYAGPEVDVWSCGVILYALLCGRLPFDDENLSGLYAKIKVGTYTFPHYLSPGARDLITRILVVDPVSRISIPEIHKHAWFQKHLPKYISCSVKTLHSGGMVDFQVLEEMGKLGFDLQEVFDSLNKMMQNQATVTYYLLLHKRVDNKYYDNHELLRSSPSGCMGRQETYLRPIPPVQGNWMLGFKSCAAPNETMRDVLSALESLNVRWKKIGPYNMRCLWQPTTQSNCIPVADSKLAQIEEEDSENVSSHDAVKFEIQLYKAGTDSYVIDWERLSGPPLLFMDLCVGFRALLIA